MIYFIMVLIILTCLIAYMAFFKAKHLIKRVTTRIQEGAGRACRCGEFRNMKIVYTLVVLYFAIAAYGKYHYLLPWHNG